MKKKLAICGNGWNYDLLAETLEGIKEYSEKEDFDVFVFMCFASYSVYSDMVRGELNVYDMMNPEDYDGVIVFSTSLNSTDTALELCNRAKEKNVPVISVGLEVDGISSVCLSNEEGMRGLVTHLIEQHGVERAFFIVGTPDHVDSVTRLQAAREVFLEHGLKLADEDVGYGRWSNKHTADIVDEVLDSGRDLPDAFICANDVMAMAAATRLEERGYNVPGDVIVTGFDFSKEAQQFYPAITTVKQKYDDIGRRACELILEEINGSTRRVNDVVPSRFACGESCGCEGDLDYKKLHIQYCSHSFKRTTDARLLEQNERVLRQWLSDVESYEAMRDALRDHYLANHQFEGDSFFIVIDGEYFSNLTLDEKELGRRARKKGKEILLAFKDNKIVDGLSVNAKKIVPGYKKNDGEQHVYFILPMHYFEYTYGYVVFTDIPYILREGMLYPYMEKLQQSFKIMRTNLRLKRLNDIDRMTGLLNRYGYENKALPLYEESLTNKAAMMVMFVDINYLKIINDDHGHLHGDNAIMTVVQAIEENLTKGAIAVRFGGDEFLILAPDHDEARAAVTRQAILDSLKRYNDKRLVPYDISVSIGYAVTDPVKRADATLQDYIREADKLMYEIKKEMHAENDRRKS
ncbi:MAG: GGDEF domain-containing protein [Lachnospiraceae bacterium]|nr:GGDEF domain-containing protein [Lachnospiraceae bacterium]